MRKISIMIISIIAMISLAKCGYDEMVYRDKTPQINPNPTKKVRIHGKFPFDENVTLKFNVAYVNKNPKCDTIHKAFGVFTAAVTKKIEQLDSLPATINKDGTYEATVFLDSYLPGVCEYEPLFMDFKFKDKTYEDGGAGLLVRFVNKNVQKHDVNISCELYKRKFEWAKSSNESGYYCELEKNQYFVDYSKMVQTTIQTHRYSVEDLALHGDYNEISIQQKDIKVNFSLKGKK